MRSAATVQTSAPISGEIALVVAWTVVRNPVSMLAPATTSILPSSLSAMPLALDQAVLSWKSLTYGVKKTNTPPIMVTTIARSITTPMTSLTARSSSCLLRDLIIQERIIPPLMVSPMASPYRAHPRRVIPSRATRSDSV